MFLKKYFREIPIDIPELRIPEEKIFGNSKQKVWSNPRFLVCSVFLILEMVFHITRRRSQSSENMIICVQNVGDPEHFLFLG